MPFTPFHMGPGLLFKAVLQGSFSLMVFGWTQIIMDLQPLIVLIIGEGQLHGFTHTLLGASLIALLAGATGKPLSEFGLRLFGFSGSTPMNIRWAVVWGSAFLGSYSHVILDGIMHGDLQPYFPWSLNNPFLGAINVSLLHKLCLYSGLIGAGGYYGIGWCLKREKGRHTHP